MPQIFGWHGGRIEARVNSQEVVTFYYAFNIGYRFFEEEEPILLLHFLSAALHSAQSYLKAALTTGLFYLCKTDVNAS